MKISELRDGTRKVDMEAEVWDVGPTRNTKTGKRVASATLKDDTGEIILSLWDEQIEQVPRGAHVSISNGYVTSYNDKPQLNVGQWGKLEVLGQVAEPPADIRQGTLTLFSPAQEARIREIVREESQR